MRRNRGFTLIELLVTIAIIGILASVVIASLNAARVKGKDATRKVELKKLQVDLDLYYGDHSNMYPSTGGVWYGLSPNAGNQADWIPGLAPAYLPSLPNDPVYMPSACGGWGGTYLYISDGTDFKLISHCPQSSNVGLTTSADEFYDPVRPTWAWQVSTPGGLSKW